MPEAQFLLWVDLETTGLDPEADSILEIGAIMTTVDLELTGLTVHSLVTGLTDYVKGRLTNNHFVHEMHTANGLLAELDKYGGMSVHDMENVLISAVASTSQDPMAVALAGSGVSHFDAQVLKFWMPSLMAKLHYRSFDINGVRTMEKAWVPGWIPTENDKKPHRAMDDVRLHLQDARAIRKAFVEAKSAKHNSGATVPIPRPTD